jgi:hypothetical protein
LAVLACDGGGRLFPLAGGAAARFSWCLVGVVPWLAALGIRAAPGLAFVVVCVWAWLMSIQQFFRLFSTSRSRRRIWGAGFWRNIAIPGFRHMGGAGLGQAQPCPMCLLNSLTNGVDADTCSGPSRRPSRLCLVCLCEMPGRGIRQSAERAAVSLDSRGAPIRAASAWRSGRETCRDMRNKKS